MFRIEKIGESHFYIKVLGTFPPSVTTRFINEFNEYTKDCEKFSVIVDGADFILLNLESFKVVLEFLRKNNDRLNKAAYVISKNPLLQKEVQILLNRAESSNRKIVYNLDDAKEWIELEEISVEKQ